MLSVSQWCPSTHIKHYKHAKNHTMISAVCLERQAVTAPQQLQQQRQQSKQQQQQQHQATQSASLQTWSKQVYNNHLLNTPSSMGRRRRKPTSKRRGTDTTTSTASSSSSSSSRDALEHIRLWTPLHNKLLQSLRRQQVLPQHARVLVAVSGGQVGCNTCWPDHSTCRALSHPCTYSATACVLCPATEFWALVRTIQHCLPCNNSDSAFAVLVLSVLAGLHSNAAAAA
jgi:hypothetical protein